MSITLDTVATAYVATRDEISALNEEISRLKKVQSAREDYMHAELVKLGLKNVQTPGGATIFTTVSESVRIADWDTALQWVKDSGAWEYLTHGFNKTAVLEYMGRNRENPTPPGVNYTAVRTVQVRRGADKERG